VAETAYVVTRPFPESGLGSNLASMAGAWELARRLGRDLVVDWRGMVFLKDASVNYFTRYFAQVPELDGVRIHYAPSPEAGDHLESADEARREIVPNELAAVLGADPAALPRYLVLTEYHGLDRMGSGDRAAEHFRLRRFYRSLALRPDVQGKLDAFYDAHLANAFVVGINLGTGNIASPTGRYYYGRFDSGIFENRERLLRRIGVATWLAVRRLPRELRATRRVFYATDSAWMSDLLGRLADSHTRRTIFPPAGAGRFFVDYEQLGHSDELASEDMVIDHFLLGRCDALVYNGSMFSNYARVLTNHFSGNSRNLDSLYARYWAATVSRRARPAVRRLLR
jgi:hypothetical protein